MSDQAPDSSGPGPGPSSSSSPLPPIPPEPTWSTSASDAIIQDRQSPPRLVSLTLSDQLVLLQICLVHKYLYTERRGNTDYWQCVAFHFWDISGWSWARVRNYVQHNIRRYRADPLNVRDNPEGQMKQLLREFIAHIDSVNSPVPQIQTQRPLPSSSSHPQHTIHGNSPVDTYSRPPSMKDSDQELIAKSKEAAMRGNFDEAKSQLLRISNKAVLETHLEELDMIRKDQIQTNEDIERQAKEAELKDDWQTAKSLLSRIVGEDGPFLLLALEYSRARIEWDVPKAEEAMGQLKRKYPDPRLEQVELDESYVNADMSGNPQRVGHYRGLLRANKRKIGTLWEEPDDFRKVFQMMAEEMRQARDKAWYARPAPAGETEPQSQPKLKALNIDEGLRMLERARAEIESQPDTTQELRLLEMAQTALIDGHDKAKALLSQGSSEECQEALQALEQSASQLVADFEEAETSLIAQTKDDEPCQLTPENQMALVVLMEAEAKANEEKVESLLAQLPRNSSETRSLRKEWDEVFAKKSRYLATCRATLLAGGNLEDVEPEQ
ncbi:hypothetical protein ACN38_g3652 [Penicillium nordicum]|uniref:Uncharacterized protein n=1 Tax=Penicillium nordicum TaxID=229535 RepID=A0A0M8PDG1_9EURO|nr:hypothetical protein ACN38_g3652 [Penicillium nordicum]